MRARLCRRPGQHPLPAYMSDAMRDLHDGRARHRNMAPQGLLPGASCMFCQYDGPGMESATSAAGNAAALQVADSALPDNAMDIFWTCPALTGAVASQVVDSAVLRFPKAVTHFSAGSYSSRPAADHLAAQRVHGRRLGEGRAARRKRPVAGEAESSLSAPSCPIDWPLPSPLSVRYAHEQQASWRKRY